MVWLDTVWVVQTDKYLDKQTVLACGRDICTQS